MYVYRPHTLFFLWLQVQDCDDIVQAATLCAVSKQSPSLVTYPGYKRSACTAVACGNMHVHVIPKLVGRIIMQHSVSCHVVAMGVARDIFPSFDLLYANQYRYNSLEWRDKALGRLQYAAMQLSL